MLHNFSCTAYEIEDYNFKKLKELDLLLAVDIEMERDRLPDSWDGDKLLWNKEMDVPNGFEARLDGMPFVKAEVLLNTGEKLNIIVGSTGTYIFNLRENETIVKLKLIGTGNEGVEFREQFTIAIDGSSEIFMSPPTFTFFTYALSQPIIKDGKEVISYRIYQQPLQMIGEVKEIPNLDKILYMSIEINPLIEMDNSLGKYKDPKEKMYEYKLDGESENTTMKTLKEIWPKNPGDIIPKPVYLSDGLIANLFVQYKVTNEGEGKENA